jgi:nitrogen fixation/metabolism regulation signal transduction histidine kinase
MDTDAPSEYTALLAALRVEDWSSLLGSVRIAEAWLDSATPGDPRIQEIVSSLVLLASHSKWEIRRAVATTAAQVVHPAFEPALATLLTDDNTRVRQAAEHAALRRRDWRNASTLGRQHEDRINSTLDDIEVRFGPRGREAVKRASEQIANTFARELYHEVIKLLSPLAMSTDRLRAQLSEQRTTRAELAEEAARIERRITHLRAVLDGMRAYTELPRLTFEVAPLKEIIEDAASLVRDIGSGKLQPAIHIQVEAAAVADVSRARLVQALTNVLANAVESYDGTTPLKPIDVRADIEEGRITISIQDSGCGMSAEALADATVLFATSKQHGTGFGLPLAIKIIESEHGGRLTLESVKGHGTVARIVIPTHRPRGSM